MSVLKNILRVFYTVVYLKPSQLYGRIWFILYRPSLNLSKAPERRLLKGWIYPVLRPPSYVSNNKFRFLNQLGEINSCDDWNTGKQEKLWLYNLHYFNYLQSEDASKPEQVSYYNALIGRWIAENPLGYGNGWEPYPISLRLVNWIKWLMDGNLPLDDMLYNMTIQTRYLSKRCEHHLLGNHLFVNGKALLFAGLFFKGEEADIWFSKGRKIINREIAEQILIDGGNFERTPMYHAIFLEDLLDIINILKAFGRPVPENIYDLIAPMLLWLQAMSHPDGEISFFNDSVIGISSSYEKLSEYAQRLGIKFRETEVKRLSVLKESGYIRVHYNQLDAILDLAPIGPDYLPAHAHADSLSFELSFFGHRCFVNSGTSVYGASEERLRQRGTAAHNTVVIDGENSSEVWGGFRVARRARIKDVKVIEQEDEIFISAAHTGYMRLSGRPVHKREWKFLSNKLAITDYIVSGKINNITIHFHFHPDWDVSMEGKKVTLKRGEDIIWVEFDGLGTIKLLDSSFHPEFGISIPSKKIIYHRQEGSSGTIKTIISWGK